MKELVGWLSNWITSADETSPIEFSSVVGNSDANRP